MCIMKNHHFRRVSSKNTVLLTMVLSFLIIFQTSSTAERLYLNKVYYQTLSNANGFVIAVHEDGTLWGWGEDIIKWGRDLGLFDVKTPTTPVKVRNDGKVRSIAAGLLCWMYIMDDGSLWFQGANPIEPYREGRDIWELTKIADNVVSAACGNDMCAYVTADGSLYMWGVNTDGELGDGTREICPKPKKMMDDVIMVSISGSHTVALKRDGSVWDWVFRYDPKNPEFKYVITKVMDGAIYVSAGSMHAAAIKADKSLWTWGSNSYGQIGNGKVSQDYVETPVKVMDNVATVHADWVNTAAIKEDGSLWLWGPLFGEVNKTKPEIVAKPKKYMDDTADVVLGAYNIYVTKKDGSLWYWGLSSYRMGSCNPFGTEGIITKPTPVPLKVKLPSSTILKGKTPFTDVPFGYLHEDAIKWAYDHGIVTGYGGRFGPEDNLSEAQIAIMLARYGNVPYHEDTAGSHYAEAFYQALAPYHLPFQGYTDPSAYDKRLNRGQIAQIIAAVYGLDYSLEEAIIFMYINNFSNGTSATKKAIETYGKDLPLTRAAAAAFFQRMSDVTEVVDIEGNIIPVESRQIIGLKE